MPPPYDPTRQSQRNYERQQAERQRQADAAFRQAESDQAAAERLVAQRQKQDAKAADAAARDAFKAEQTQREHEFRAEGASTYTTADGVIHKDPLFDQKQAQKAQQEAEKAAKEAAALAAKQARAEAIRSGRRHQINPVDGTPIYLESEEAVSQRQKEAGEKLRRTELDKQIAAREAEFGLKKAQNEAAGFKPLSETARKALESKGLAKAKQDALFALQSHYGAIAKGTDKQGWWDVVNNNATPEAQKAQEALQRLQSPDAELTDDDLAALESSSDPTNPALVKKLRVIQERIAKDDELRKAEADHNLSLADLKMRRDAPDQWAESMRQRRATLPPDQLDAELQTSGATLQERAAAMEQQASQLNGQLGALNLELETLSEQAAQRRSQGIPAGEIVTYDLGDGTTEAWPRDLAAQREQITARLQDTQAQQADAWALLKVQQEEWNRDAALHDEAVRQQETRQQTQQQQQIDALRSRLQFTPGMEQTAKDLDAIRGDAEVRRLVLDDMYPDGIPDKALEALNADVNAKAEQTIQAGKSRFNLALHYYADIRTQLAENPALNATAGDLFIDARQKLAQDAGISEAEARRLLADAEALDWDQATADEMNKGLVAESWKSAKNMMQPEDARKTRILSNGAVIVHPRLSSEKDYKEAVQSSNASPEAKQDALDRYPEIRAQQARQTLETIQHYQKVLGEDATWKAWEAKRPKDVTPEEWALQFTEKNKAATEGPLGSMLAKTKQFGTGLLQSVADLVSQASALGAGILGSNRVTRGIADQELMGFSQRAANSAAALSEQKAIYGQTSDTFLTRGVFDQLPRIAGSLLPTAAGSKIAMGATRLFAATKLGARFLPSLAAAVNKSADMGQMVKAVDTLRRVGMAGAATAGGAQTYAAQLGDIYTRLRKDHPEMTHAEALQQAQMPALYSGLATSLITLTFGSKGIERFLTRPQEAKELAAKIFTSRMQQIGFVGKEFVKGGAWETLEEGPDEAISQMLAAAATAKPGQENAAAKQALAEFFQQLPDLAVATGILGGLGHGVAAIQDSSVNRNRSHLPETAALAWDAIENHVAIDAAGNVDAALTDQQQRRASLALSLAQGGELFDVEEADLNAAGWTRDGDQFKPLKDYTGPQVLDIDKGGLPVVKDSYKQALRDHGLAAVADAIPETETETRNRHAQASGSQQPPQSNQPGPQQPQPGAAQGAAPDAVAGANQGPVQNPPGQGPQPSRGGSSAAPDGPAVGGQTSASAVTEAPATVSDTLANHLVERGLPENDAKAAAARIVEQPEFAGMSYEQIIAEGPKFRAALTDLGIDGSLNSKDVATNPLKIQPGGRLEKVKAAAGSTKKPTAQGLLYEQAENGQRTQTTAETSAHANKLADTLEDGDIIESEGSRFKVVVSKNGGRTLELIDDNDKPLGQTLTLTSPERTNANGTVLPARGNSASAIAVIERGRVIKSAGQSPANQEAAADPFVVNDVNPVNNVTPADFATLRQQLKNREISDQDAARQVAEQTGATTPESFMAAVEKHLGWKPARAEIAAHLHFGTKDQSSIPLAAETRASNRSTNPGSSIQDPAPRQGPDASLAATPSALRKNRAYAADKLRVLAGIKDPARKAWARQFFIALEQSLQRHHLLYDAYAVGQAARRHLDGQMTAVLEIDGKITRLLDLDAMAAQFSYLGSPQDALRATSIEEDIHAQVLQLAREQPDKYGYKALRRKWQQLPDALKQAVWTAYRAANQQAANAAEVKLPKLSANQEWHMMNEFLRMLVQDARFAGQITETVDPSSGLLGWVKNFLRDLSKLLKSLMGKVQPTLRAELDAMVKQIGDRLQQIETASAAQADRLAVLPSHRDPAAYATRVLSTLGTQPNAGILSNAALARIFDQLDPALQSRAFDLWKSSIQDPASTKAPKDALMRGLLSQFLGSRRQARQLLDLLAGITDNASGSKSSNLLAKIASRFRDKTTEELLTSQSPATRQDLSRLLTATLHAIGGFESASWVHGIAANPAASAILQEEEPETTSTTPEAAPTPTRGRRWLLSQTQRPLRPGTPPKLPAGLPPPPPAPSARQQAQAMQDRQQRQDDFQKLIEQEEAANLAGHTLTTLRAELDDYEMTDDERTHYDARTAAGRQALRQVFLARQHHARLLRQQHAAELQQALQAARGDAAWEALGSRVRGLVLFARSYATRKFIFTPGRFATATQPAEIGGWRLYREGDWKLIGSANQRKFADFGVAIDLDLGTLSATPDSDFAVAPTRDPGGYGALSHLILKQQALDDIATYLPATAAYLHFLIGSESDQRQRLGIPDENSTGNTSSPNVSQEQGATSDQTWSQQKEGMGSGLSLTATLQTGNSGDRVARTSTAATPAPTPPTPPQSPALPRPKSPPLDFPIPLSKRGQVRRSQFPDADSLAAFQFKLDADTVASARSTPAEVKKAEQRGLSLLARLMEETGLSRADLEKKLIDYHTAVVEQAEKASAFGTFTPPSFTSSASSIQDPASSLPPPVGGDILSGMREQGIRRLGPPDASDGWSWYRELQADASRSKLKNTEAQRLARAGDITDAKAKLAWIDANVVSQTGGRSIDEAAAELSESDSQQFPVQSGDELGRAILDALDARLAARQDPASSIQNQESSREAEAVSAAQDFATYAAGVTGQPFTAEQLSRELEPEDEIQIGSEWFTVQETDPLTLDSARFGSITLRPDQTLNLTAGPNHLRIDRGTGNPARTSSTNPETLAAIQNALPPGQRDFLAPSAIETTLKPLPPEQLATPQDVEEMDADLRASIDAGEALDASLPAGMEESEDLAENADDWLDENTALAAATRSRRDATFEPGIKTPFGTLLRYSWMHRSEDVFNPLTGEVELKRVSDWDKALTNAETGREIVHHFTVSRPDGTTQTVSLETALGSMTAEQKKSTNGIIRALRRLPVNEALLAHLKAKQAAYLAAVDEAYASTWKQAPDITLSDPDFTPLRESGIKAGYIGKTFVGNFEPSELPLSPAKIQNAKVRWALENITTPKLTYDEQNKLESLPRIIKKDREALRQSGTTSSGISTTDPTGQLPLFASNRLAEVDPQRYFALDDVRLPVAKQPAASAAIAAAGNASGEPYPSQLPANAGKLRKLRESLEQRRADALRAWRGLTSGDKDAIAAAFEQNNGRISSLLHEFIQHGIPGFDIRGAVIENPQDFAAYNLAVRTPYFESVKIAVLGDGRQVIHSQIVHVGSLNESIFSPVLIAGIIDAARLANPKLRIEGFLIAHNHPSGDTEPSDADKRSTNRLRDIADTLGVPFLDHVITNGSSYYSFRENDQLYTTATLAEGSRPRKPKLPVLPTPEQIPARFPYERKSGILADWEVVPSGDTDVRPRIESPWQIKPLLEQIGTADPLHHHLIYLDTRMKLRAVERIPADTQNVAALAITGAAREGASGIAIGFAPRPTSTGTSVMTAQEIRIHARLRDGLKNSGIRYLDAGGFNTSSQEAWSAAEMGLQEDSTSLASAPRLSAFHNLSPENLAYADRMGGLAVPSIAVLPEGQAISGFGSITLIGTRDLVDPRKNPVFDADAYTARFPDPEYKRARTADAQSLVNKLRPFERQFDDSGITGTLWDNAVNNPNPQDSLQRLQRSLTGKAAFLAEQGTPVEPVMMDKPIGAEWVLEPAFAPYRANPSLIKNLNPNDEPTNRALAQAIRTAIAEYVRRTESGARVAKVLIDSYIDKDTGLPLFGRTMGIEKSLDAIGQQQVDTTATTAKLDAALAGREAAFQQWVERQILPIMGEPRLTLKGRKVPYTLDNIVQAMTSARVRGGENVGSFFGEGAARGNSATRFKDLEQMRGAAAVQIMPEEQVSAARENARKLLADWREAVADYTTLRNWKSQPDIFGAFDAAMRAIARWAKGSQTPSALRTALQQEDFANVPDAVITQGQKAAEAFAAAPVPYFESKPQRAVLLNEFVGAVIPDSEATGTTADILQRHGIPFRTYTGSATQQTTAAQFAQDLADKGALFASNRNVDAIRAAAALASGQAQSTLPKGLQGLFSPSARPQTPPPPGTPRGLRRLFAPVSPSPRLPISQSLSLPPGSSTVWQSLKDAYQSLKAAGEDLTPAQFMRELKAAYDANQVALEFANSQAEIDAARPFVLPTENGPAIRMALLAAAPRITEPPFDTPERKALEESRIHAIDTYLHGKRRPIAETPPADQARSSRAQLPALLTHLRRSQRTGGSSAPDAAARRAADRRRDKALLIDWARDAGLLITDPPARYDLDGPLDKGGAEHHVFHDQDGRWVKITKGDGTSYGYQPRVYRDEWDIAREGADAASYLEKLLLQNNTFHDDIVLHAVWADRVGNVALITSQPHYEGEYAPQETAIKPAMEGAGFIQLDLPSAYYRPADNLAVLDLHTENAITQDNGTFLRVFDNIILHPTGALRATFERLASERSPALAASNRLSSIVYPPSDAGTPARTSDSPRLPVSPSQSLATQVAAAAAATDPTPSDAQKRAGNYQKGKVDLHGLRISIENPAGSVRSGTDASGKPWSITLPHHYGYILGSEGRDGDHVDVFIGPNPDSQLVLIINQRKGDAGTPARSVFDEHKVMLGFNTPAEAARGYMASYTKGWKGLQSAVPTTLPVFKHWLSTHDTTQPVTPEQIQKLAKTLPTPTSPHDQSPVTTVNPVNPVPLPASNRTSPKPPLSRRILTKAQSLDRKLLTVPGAAQSLDLAGKSVDLTGALASKVIKGLVQAPLVPLRVNGYLAEQIGLQSPLATFGSNNLDKRLAAQLDKLAGPKVRSAKSAVETWLDKPDGLAPSIKGLVDQVLPTALMPREWLALHHEMQRKTAYGAETANDLIRALSGNPRLSDLAYPKEFAENPQARQQLFDAMEGRVPMSTLPPEMQRLGQRLRDLLRQTGSELVRQGLMNPDTFEELQQTGWMPRYTEDEARETAGSFLAAFKLGVRDLLQQRSTAYHIVDTTRKDKTGQFVTVSRDEGGKRNRWRFRDAATRDAFYHDFVRKQTLDMLQESGNKVVADMLAPLSRGDRAAIRSQIKTLTIDQIANTAKLSPMLAGIVKQAKKHQYDRFLPKDPFEPAKLIKDPVYAVARYVLGQTHNAATMELLRKTAQHPEWVSDVSLTGFEAIPDASRFGPLAGKHVRKDIARQILDLVDVPNAALQFYDAILRKWKAGKLVWNPGSHIRDAVGNTVFAYLGGSSIWNPGNWPYYQKAIKALREGGSDFAELVEQQVIGGDAYSGLVKERLKGLLPDPKTVENYDPGFVQRLLFGFGATLHGSHEFLTSLRRIPDDLYKSAAYFKHKADLASDPNLKLETSNLKLRAAEHVRKWFPYYDRLGQSGTTRAVGRFVNPFFSFFRESTRILGHAVAERPLALTTALAFPALITAASAIALGLDDDDMEEVKKDLSGKGKLFATDTSLFSMLLPVRSAQGALQQFDISAIMPFADLLGTRVAGSDANEDPWNRFWRGIVSGGPVLSLIDAWRHNEDAFTRRPIAEFGMTPLEKITAYTRHAAGVALPPLAPGGTAFATLTRAGDRSTNKTLETYDPAQAVMRSVVGLNVKNATPDLYRLADDWRKAHGYEVTEGMDYGSTTPASRARKALFAQLAQDQPNLTAIGNILKALDKMGHPVRTEQDINRLLFYRDPMKLIGGNKARGITPADAQAQFRASLQGEARQALERALQEFNRIKAKAPQLIRQATLQ